MGVPFAKRDAVLVCASLVWQTGRCSFAKQDTPFAGRDVARLSTPTDVSFVIGVARLIKGAVGTVVSRLPNERLSFGKRDDPFDGAYL